MGHSKTRIKQLLVLLIGVLAGLVASTLLVTFFFVCYQKMGGEKSLNDLLIWVQALQSIAVFIIPPLLVARWIAPEQESAYSFLKMKQKPNKRFLWYAILTWIAAMPLLNAVISWNEGMQLPAFMSNIEAWMSVREKEATLLTDMMLNTSSYWGLLLNLIVVAGIAAVGEELLFRGSLQRLLSDWFKSPHWAVWIIAFIFSAIHLQFYGFLPRLLLGALLGYLYLWSGNLWVPILVHFANNAVAVVVQFCDFNYGFSATTFEGIGVWNSATWGLSFMSLAIVILLLRKLYGLRVKDKK